MRKIMMLRPLTREQCQIVREWRLDARETLRTSHMPSEMEQDRFYDNVVSNPNSPHRYWAIVDKWEERKADADKTLLREGTIFYGLGGLTNIQWENRIAEISLIISPEHRNEGNGREAVFLLLDEGFSRMNLKTIYGEVYACNPSYEFWMKRITELEANCSVTLPNRKYWDGKYYHGQYFSFDRDDFIKGKEDVRVQPMTKLTDSWC